MSQAKYKNYPIQKEVNHFKVSLVKEKDYFVGTNAFVESHIKLNSYSTDLDVYVSPVNIKITQTFAPSKGIELTTPLINKTFHIKSGESFKENFTVAFMPKEAGEYQFTTRVEMNRGKRNI